MPAKRRGKAVIIPSSPAYTFGCARPDPSAAGAHFQHASLRQYVLLLHLQRGLYRMSCLLTILHAQLSITLCSCCLGCSARFSIPAMAAALRNHHTEACHPRAGSTPGPGTYNVHTSLLTERRYSKSARAAPTCASPNNELCDNSTGFASAVCAYSVKHAIVHPLPGLHNLTH